LRLRQVDEQEAMRGLERARQAVERATGARDRARAEMSELSQRMEQSRAGSGRMTVGALVARDGYRTQLRTLLAGAEERVRAGERALRDALRGLTEAQQQVERALRAREAAERQRSAQDKTLARQRERRDQAATDDRWRPPRR
jgi:hypothetical protein